MRRMVKGLLPALLLSVAILGFTPYIVYGHYVDVDGYPEEWLSVNIAENTHIAVGGEYIWHDAAYDTRNDFVTIVIDGSSDDWLTDQLKYVFSRDSTDRTPQAGANLDTLFIGWNDNYLYIAFNTSNTQSWNVAYGIGIDAIPNQGYNDTTGGSDAWDRAITFDSTEYGIDYEIYFWWDGSGGTITSNNFCNWSASSSSWDYYTLNDIGGSYGYTGDSNIGLQFLELEIPWTALGFNKPVNFSIIIWVTGDTGSSAVDTVPYDPASEDSDDEWNDPDVLSFLKLFVVEPKYATMDTLVDITWVQITSDNTYLYMLIRFNDLYYVGHNGAPGIMITIDTNTSDTSGGTYFGYNSETQVASNGSANWQRQILIDLANSAVQDGQPVYGDGVEVWNGGSPLDVVDTSWNDVSSSSSLFVANTSNDVVEIGVTWSDLGISDPANITLRIEVAVVRVTPEGDAWDPDGGSSSDVLDCVTTTGPNTWDEVSDGYVDYYLEVPFNSVPEPIPEPGILIGVATVLLTIAALVFYYKR